MTTYTVNTTSDIVLAGDGLLSLREAVQAANSNAAVGDVPAGTPGEDIIQFDAGLTGTIFLGANGELAISEDLTIDGDGRITLSGKASASETVADNRVIRTVGPG